MTTPGSATSLPGFQRVFPHDEACAKYVESLRWPNGFACLKCGWQGAPYRFGTRRSVVIEVDDRHDALAFDCDPDKAEAHLPMIYLVSGNLKPWLTGTRHGVSQRHLPAYLNEFVFRFNRRSYRINAFNPCSSWPCTRFHRLTLPTDGRP